MNISMQLVGIDLAWLSEKNNTAMAIGDLQDKTLRVREIIGKLTSLKMIVSYIESQPQLRGVAIDASLIINNTSGQRECERAVGQEYGSRKAGCHSSNLTLYPDPQSVRLSWCLTEKGFKHLGPSEGNWQIECYPHTALIEIFGLSERHLYKKGEVGIRREGQAKLADMLTSLATSDRISLEIPDHVHHYFDRSHIMSLKGADLKANEDALDAVVCLYVAALYASDAPSKTFGDVEDGYIYVPKVKCVSTPRRKSRGTTTIGYLNKNQQQVMEATGKPGTDHCQSIYILECQHCGNRYGANGSDIWQRKCPSCQGGAPGTG